MISLFILLLKILSITQIRNRNRHNKVKTDNSSAHIIKKKKWVEVKTCSEKVKAYHSSNSLLNKSIIVVIYRKTMIVMMALTPIWSFCETNTKKWFSKTLWMLRMFLAQTHLPLLPNIFQIQTWFQLLPRNQSLLSTCSYRTSSRSFPILRPNYHAYHQCQPHYVTS